MAQDVPKKQRIVVSLSTIPSRCDKLEETLISLASQTMKPEAIFISVSKESKREGVPYPIKDLAKTVKRIIPGVGKIIVLEDDYGPLTKLMGPLFNEQDPNTLIITVDDDQKYGEKMVETLVKGSREHPKSAICLCGHVIGKFPHVWGYRCSRKDRVWPLKQIYLKPGTQVDVVSGWCGVLYPRGVFPMPQEDGSTLPDPAMETLRKETLPILHRHDDLYISGWLDLLKVKKFVVAYDTKQSDGQLGHAYKNSLSMGNNGPTPSQGIKHMNEFWGVVRALRSRGMLVSNLTVKWYNSTVTLTAIGTAIVVATAIGIIIFSNKYRHSRVNNGEGVIKALAEEVV